MWWTVATIALWSWRQWTSKAFSPWFSGMTSCWESSRTWFPCSTGSRKSWSSPRSAKATAESLRSSASRDAPLVGSWLCTSIWACPTPQRPTRLPERSTSLYCLRRCASWVRQKKRPANHKPLLEPNKKGVFKEMAPAAPPLWRGFIYIIGNSYRIPII